MSFWHRDQSARFTMFARAESAHLDRSVNRFIEIHQTKSRSDHLQSTRVNFSNPFWPILVESISNGWAICHFDTCFNWFHFIWLKLHLFFLPNQSKRCGILANFDNVNLNNPFWPILVKSISNGWAICHFDTCFNWFHFIWLKLHLFFLPNQSKRCGILANFDNVNLNNPFWPILVKSISNGWAICHFDTGLDWFRLIWLKLHLFFLFFWTI